MKALTVTQPWADLIARGVKTIETRDWATKHRGPLAIHAGLGKPSKALSMAYGYPPRDSFGAVVAVANLTDCTPYRLEDQPAAVCDWRPEAYSWRLADVQALPYPVKVRGLQRLWNLPEPVTMDVEQQLEDLKHRGPWTT